MKFLGSIEEFLHLEIIDSENAEVLNEASKSSLSILWFESDQNEIIIDGEKHVFSQNQIVFFTEFHKVEVIDVKRVRFLKFNRPFYCILDHDTEVGCKGILFFGASQLPVVQIPAEEIDIFETLWKMFTIEMESNDSLQIEMLQMMLKRYLILCARVYKSQKNFPKEKGDLDIVREFNFLVESHFKTKHSVAEYAELMNKSPKTLSNIFSKIGSKPPSQYIQDRILLEAKRLLHYSNLHIKEIAFEIGYEDTHSFGRFFKKQEGISPSEFKEKTK